MNKFLISLVVSFLFTFFIDAMLKKLSPDKKTLMIIDIVVFIGTLLMLAFFIMPKMFIWAW